PRTCSGISSQAEIRPVAPLRCCRSVDRHELHERHHVFAISALGMLRLPARNPGLKATGYGKKKLLYAFAHVGRDVARQDRGKAIAIFFRSKLVHGFDEGSACCWKNLASRRE